MRLVIDQPADLATLREDSVSIRRRVSPARALVRVRGERAPGSGGQFEATVPLEPGVNVIDVMASAADGARSKYRTCR